MSSITPFCVFSTEIRQYEGLYSLNDLHKAAGGENRHKPNLFLTNQQTTDLIKEIEIAGIPAILSKQGLGTFGCKEVVVAYGAWISPKVQLAVIRAFLEKQTVAQAAADQAPEKPTIKALPGGLTMEQQDAVKALVKARVEALPKDKQAKGAITLWSSLKSKYGCTYKEIAPEHFTACLSLVSRLPLEGEYIKVGDTEISHQRVLTVIEHGRVTQVKDLTGYHLVRNPGLHKLRHNLRLLADQLRWMEGEESDDILEIEPKALQ